MNALASPRRVCLDDATNLIKSFVPEWTSRGIAADVVVRSGSSSLEQCEVVGVHLRCGRLRGRVMLFGAGWADLEFAGGPDREDLFELHPINNANVDGLTKEMLDRLTGSIEQHCETACAETACTPSSVHQ